MLGLDDRTSIHEPATEKIEGKSAVDKKVETKGAPAKSGVQPGKALPDDKRAGAEPPTAAPEKRARAANGVYEFRDARWVELYNNKIDEMIGVRVFYKSRCAQARSLRRTRDHQGFGGASRTRRAADRSRVRR
jgi:hypothetical protein